MTLAVRGGKRTGVLAAPPSKSKLHRMLICGALSDVPNSIICRVASDDIEATVSCLNALGASIERHDEVLKIAPFYGCPGAVVRHLFCGESGSTLRFLLPLCGALDRIAVFHMEGRLPERPNDEYEAELMRHGMNIARENGLLLVSGKLEAGTFRIPGNVSSQFVSGLMFALPLLRGDSEIVIDGKTESVDYVRMTVNALAAAGIEIGISENTIKIKGDQTYRVSGCAVPEGDWSNAAFFLCMGAASRKGITVSGLDTGSDQGDRRILGILEGFGASVEKTPDGIFVREGRMKPQTIDASDVPDLVPALAALASGIPGETVFENAGRLRFKESDRIKSTVRMINSLGGEAAETGNGIVVKGRKTLSGGIADTQNDHRIAMACAVMSSFCSGDVRVEGHKCVAKSYPGFWEDFFGLEEIV
ncbi:MAG: 3-phosphoshikimate 1-carboxyvinyltransferase [Clostridia bacterium]|nr:3-phosphoshikimate 1-carboxyvinyltransferase [Clostridia bacterium]